MQRTSRTLPVVAANESQSNVVRLQRKVVPAVDQETSTPVEVANLSALMERASNAARQMQYFALAAKQLSLDDLTSSALRAGFIEIVAKTAREEASFRFASGQADFVFWVSYRDPERISIVAQSQADIFGLVLTAYSHVTTVSVEINPTIEATVLGNNALLFRDLLLTFPRYDDLPAWAKHPEGHIPEAVGLLKMWRDGVSLATICGQAWNSILPRLIRAWELLQERWYPR